MLYTFCENLVQYKKQIMVFAYGKLGMGTKERPIDERQFLKWKRASWLLRFAYEGLKSQIM
jgi:hypothetical protein